jgi:MFS family permease
MAINAGFAFGPATAGFLAKKSFLCLFFGDAATSAIFGLVAWFALPSGLRSSEAGNNLFETIRVLRRDKRFRQALVAALGIGLVFVQVFSSMSLEITRNGFSAAVYGLVISLNGALIVLCELPLTTLTRRFPARRAMALGFVLIGAGFASNALVRTIPLLLLTTVLFTVGEMISMPISAAYVADLAPTHQRGLYMGAYGMVWAAAFVFGPSLGLWLFSLNHIALWLSCGAIGLLAAGIILVDPRPGAELSARGHWDPATPVSEPARD